MVPSIDIVVLNWNGKDDTIACLDSLCRSSFTNKRVTVVDNGSSDDSISEIRRRHPDVEMVCTGRNLGYAGGNNAGLAHCRATAKADFYLLLNNDTVAAPDFLEKLIATAARHPDAALFSPKIFYHHKPDRLWFAGGMWNPDAQDFYHLGFGEHDSSDYGENTIVDYVSGCALMMRAEVVDRIGFLDERYFLLFEEVDYCYRARKFGFKSIVSDDARLLHKVSSSLAAAGPSLGSYFHSRNRLLFGEIHLSAFARGCLMLRMFWEMLFPRILLSGDIKVPTLKKMYWLCDKKELFFLSDFRRSDYWAHLIGLRDYFNRRFGDCPASIRQPRCRRSLNATEFPRGIS